MRDLGIDVEDAIALAEKRKSESRLLSGEEPPEARVGRSRLLLNRCRRSAFRRVTLDVLSGIPHRSEQGRPNGKCSVSRTELTIVAISTFEKLAANPAANGYSGWPTEN